MVCWQSASPVVALEKPLLQAYSWQAFLTVCLVSTKLHSSLTENAVVLIFCSKRPVFAWEGGAEPKTEILYWSNSSSVGHPYREKQRREEKGEKGTPEDLEHWACNSTGGLRRRRRYRYQSGRPPGQKKGWRNGAQLMGFYSNV